MKTKDIQRMLTRRDPDAGFRTISVAKQKELLKKTWADRASIERRQEEVQLNKPVFHALRQAVNQLRFADIVQDDKPAISKFDAFQAAKSAASSTNRCDPELLGFVASMENLWQRDPAGVFTAGQVAQYRETYKKVRANSSVVKVIDRIFPKYGFNTLDTRKLSQMASEIENQNDFNILIKEAGLAGNRPEQIRARAFVLEQVNRKKAQGDGDVELFEAVKLLQEGYSPDEIVQKLVDDGMNYSDAEYRVSEALDNINELKMGNKRKAQMIQSPTPLPIAPPPPTPMPTSAPVAPVSMPQPAPSAMAPIASEDEDEEEKEAKYKRSQYGVPIPQPPEKIPDVPALPNGEGRFDDLPTPPSSNGGGRFEDFPDPPDKSPELPQPPEVVPLRGYRILEAIKTGVGVVAYSVRKPNGQVIVVPASVIDKMAEKKKAQDVMKPGANEQQSDAVPENDVPADVLLGPDSSTVDTEQLEADEINEQAEGDQVNLEPYIALLVVEAKRIASKKRMGIEKAAELAIEKTFINAPIHIKAKYWDIICKESQYLTSGVTVEQFIETYPEKYKELADALDRDDYNEITRITSGLGLSAADISDISHHIFLSKLGRGQRRGQSVLNPDTSTNDPVELEPSKKPKSQLDPNKQNGVSFAETGMESDSSSGYGMSDLPSVVTEPSSKLGGKNSNFFHLGGEDFRVGDPSLDEAGNSLAVGDQVDWSGISGEIVEFPMHGLAAVDFPEGQLRQIGVDQSSPIRVPSDELVKVGRKIKAQDEIEQQIIQMIEEGRDAIEIGIEFGLDPNEVAEIIQEYFERSAQTSTGGGELPPPEGTDISGKKDEDEEDEEKEDGEIEDVFIKEESLRHFQHMGENLDDRLIKRLAYTVKNKVGKDRHPIVEALAGKKINAQFSGAELADYVAEETGADFGELHEFIEEVAPLELYVKLDSLSEMGQADEMVELFMEKFNYWKAASRKKAYEIGDSVKWTGIGGKEHEGVVDSVDEDILWVKDESGSKAMVPEEQIEVTGKKNPWMGKKAQSQYRKGDWVEYNDSDGTVKDGVVQKTPPENLDPTIGIPEYEIGFDRVLESDIIGTVKVGNRRVAQGLVQVGDKFINQQTGETWIVDELDDAMVYFSNTGESYGEMMFNDYMHQESFKELIGGGILQKVGNRRIAQTGREYPDRQPAKGNMQFTHSKGHREGNRWVIEVGWSPEQMKGMSEGNVFAQIKTVIQMWGSKEEDFDWGDPADIQIENVDLEAGKAIVSFVSWQINNAVPATVVMSEDELVSPGGDGQRSIPGRV